MTTAYMIAESYSHRTRVPGTSLYDRQFTSRTIPARIVKVINLKYVRRAYGRVNEWRVYFDIPANTPGNESGAQRNKSGSVNDAPRFFSTHEAATKALILDQKKRNNNVARRSAVEAINVTRDDADRAARRVYDRAIQEAQNAYQAVRAENRNAAQADIDAIPEAEETGTLESEIVENHLGVHVRIEHFRSNAPSDRRSNAYQWHINNTEAFTHTTTAQRDYYNVSPPRVNRPARDSNWALGLVLPTFVDED